MLSWTRNKAYPVHPLDRLNRRENYIHLFTDTAFWEPYVHQVCATHGQACNVILTGEPGTFPTFIVDQRVVVKFFGPLFGGDRSFTVEIEAARLLAAHPVLPTASLVFAGRLNPPGASWNWPYLGSIYLDGESIQAGFERISMEDKQAMAGQLGSWVRKLHQLPLNENGPFETGWDGFEQFLENQRAGCASRQSAWGSLLPLLAAQIDDFLPPVSELVNRDIPPHLIHADLTGDHLIGSFNGGHWIPRGLIDFGDARTGNLYYELAALHLDLLRSDHRLLAIFLNSYGFSPPPDFPRRALAYCLLHEFNVFPSLASWDPSWLAAQNLDELARQIWAV